MSNFSKNIIGYDDYFNSIKNNILNKSISNSLIFYGNKGIGKTTFSLCLINSIYNILNQNTTTHTHLIYNNSHPNIKFISKILDEKSNKLKNHITIDQIRNLESFVYKSSIDSLPKFVIIDSADDLNLNSANSLLKILEEPTNNTYLILISHCLSRLLPTIRSRCVKFRFLVPNFNIFNNIVSENYNDLDGPDLNFLYDLSEGSPGLAIDLLSQNIEELFDNLLFLFKQKKPLSSEIYELSDKVSKFDNDEFKIYISVIKFILSNIIKINLGIKLSNISNSSLSNSLNDLSNYIDNNISFKILNYLNLYESNLYIFNLDKKFFNLNIFSKLSEAK